MEHGVKTRNSIEMKIFGLSTFTQIRIDICPNEVICNFISEWQLECIGFGRGETVKKQMQSTSSFAKSNWNVGRIEPFLFHLWFVSLSVEIVKNNQIAAWWHFHCQFSAMHSPTLEELLVADATYASKKWVQLNMLCWYSKMTTCASIFNEFSLFLHICYRYNWYSADLFLKIFE